jgi:hypothetical protein
MSNNIKEAIRLRGLNQDSDLGELKEALDEVTPSGRETGRTKVVTEAIMATNPRATTATAIKTGPALVLAAALGLLVMITLKGLAMEKPRFKRKGRLKLQPSH